MELSFAVGCPAKGREAWAGNYFLHQESVYFLVELEVPKIYFKTPKVTG